MSNKQSDLIEGSSERRNEPIQFRRDIDIRNVEIEKADLQRLFQILSNANEAAIALQEAYENPEHYSGEESMRSELRRIMSLGYAYATESMTHAEGQGLPNLEREDFPDALQSLYISSSKIPQQLTGQNPGNYVDIFLDFKKPPMTINLLHLPSNPTDNGSIINVIGRDEAWVISTHDKLKKFFDKRRTRRLALHGSGTYDFFLYVFFIPIWIWLLHRAEGYFFPSGLDISVLMSVAIILYLFLFSMIFARALFQYIRWLFPPVEYIPRRRVGRYIHRGVLGTTFTGLLLAAVYDIAKTVFFG